MKRKKTKKQCGAKIGRYKCTRDAGHKGPHLPQGATLRPKSRLPETWKKRNFGEGDLFNFHGTYTDKKKAVAKEQATPGAFIKTAWFKDGPRYAVVTKRANPRVESYALKSGSGKKIRQATRVIFEDGSKVTFIESLPKKKAIQQALALKAKGYKENPIAHKTKRNYADAADLYRKFHGKRADKVTEVAIADYDTHPELAQLGKLVSLMVGENVKLTGKEHSIPEKIEGEKGWSQTIQFSAREAPDVAAEPGGRQIYFVGGNQDLSGSLSYFPVDRTKELIDLGQCLRIEYFTRKHFDKFQPVTYWHVLGEETGEVPRLMFDKNRKQLCLVGGAYKVKPEGIVN
jgi:hypothetical protein